MEIVRYKSDLKGNPHLKIDGEEKFSERDEQYVWQRFIEGDDQSLIYLYNKYVDVLYGYGKQFSKRCEFIRD